MMEGQESGVRVHVCVFVYARVCVCTVRPADIEHLCVVYFHVAGCSFF